MGGKASAEARRQKRSLRNAMQTILANDYKDSTGARASGYELLCASMFKVAANPNDIKSVNAFKAIMNLMGETNLPPETNNPTIERLDEILGELRDAAYKEAE